MKTKNGWVSLDSSSVLSEDVIAKIKEENGFKYPGSWFYDCSYIRGKDFIVTTDDGAYYKVGAEFMVWYRIGERSGSQAIWSNAALKRTLKSLIDEGQTTPDPNYRT